MNRSLSDYNSTKSSNVAREHVYSDLDLLFKAHPVYKTIKPVTDLNAVVNSISNLVQTSYLERPFHPEIGSGIRALLFEPADLFTSLSLRDNIIKLINDFEPRVKNVTVQVKDLPERNSYIITIGFVVFYDRSVQFELNLNRLR
jgi:phage baseplate assembly protein W